MVDDAAAWIVDWLSSRTLDDLGRYAWFGTALLIVYLTVRWLVRRFLPWLVARIAIPVAAGLVSAGCIVLLFLQSFLALPFRPLGMRPPTLIFAFGDMIGAASRGARAAVPRLAGGVYSLGRTHRVVIWMLLAGLAWSAHEVTCDQDPASLWCRRPLGAVTQLGSELRIIGTDLVYGRSSS
jgi:hypothetical protein